MVELLIYRLIRVSVISVRYFCLIKIFCAICMVYHKKNQMYIYCIHLFVSLFIIPSQSIIGKILPNLWERRLEKPLMMAIVNKLIEQVVWVVSVNIIISQ